MCTFIAKIGQSTISNHAKTDTAKDIRYCTIFFHFHYDSRNGVCHFLSISQVLRISRMVFYLHLYYLKYKRHLSQHSKQQSSYSFSFGRHWKITDRIHQYVYCYHRPIRWCKISLRRSFP